MLDTMRTLFVSDLDGTLLRSDATLSEFSRQRLNQLLDEGLLFTVASARSVVSMGYVLSGVRITLPVIEFNGAFISDLNTGRHHIVNEIAPELRRDVFEVIRRHGRSPFVSCVDANETDLLFYDTVLNEGMRWYVQDKVRTADRRLRQISALTDALRHRVVCLTVMDRREPLEAILAEVLERGAGRIEPHLFENPYQAGWYWLTLHDTRATKDQAIRALAERWELPLDNLTVFGDQVNDIKMFREATHAIAVANARDELKTYATQVVGTNDEDSVVKFLCECSATFRT